MSSENERLGMLLGLRDAYSAAWRRRMDGREAEGWFEQAKRFASGAAAHGASPGDIVTMLREGARDAEEVAGEEVPFGLR